MFVDHLAGRVDRPAPIRAGVAIAAPLIAAGMLGLILGARARTSAAASGALPIGAASRGVDPLVSSWQTRYSGRYARVVESGGAPAVTVWPSAGLIQRGGGQKLPAYSDVQQIGYSADYVYIQGTGLASHPMGPWYGEMGDLFGNWPSNKNYVRRFPRHPRVATVKTTNGLGPLGLWVNGVALYNLLDGFIYDTTTGRERQGGPEAIESGIWVRNAQVVESPTFDASNAHQPPNGEYHYHSNPTALRSQLGDNIRLDPDTGRYVEDTTELHHSPILGWSYDGYPIYGPYGYADPADTRSAVRRMVSGYVLRDGANGTVDLRRTGRHTLAQWAANLHQTDGRLDSGSYGPDISARYPLGRYNEDFDFRGDLGGKQGRDYDLDRYNGRFCVTPEYPGGTYAYFVTIDERGQPAFPYTIGRQWNGVPSGGEVRSLSGAITLYRNAGPNSPIRQMEAESANGKTLTWSSVEGAHYRIEGTRDAKTWSVVAEEVASGGVTTTYPLPAANWKQYRIIRTSLDAYDTMGSENHGP